MWRWGWEDCEDTGLYYQKYVNPGPRPRRQSLELNPPDQDEGVVTVAGGEAHPAVAHRWPRMGPQDEAKKVMGESIFILASANTQSSELVGFGSEI